MIELEPKELKALGMEPNPDWSRIVFCHAADCLTRASDVPCRNCMFSGTNEKEFFAWNLATQEETEMPSLAVPPIDQYEGEEAVGDIVEPAELAGTTGEVFSENVITPTQMRIIEICEEIKEMLIRKNKSYGDSATNPLRLFGKSTALEGLCTRIDDKLNRIYQGEAFPGDNDVDDLIGYLVLYKIVKEKEGV